MKKTLVTILMAMVILPAICYAAENGHTTTESDYISHEEQRYDYAWAMINQHGEPYKATEHVSFEKYDGLYWAGIFSYLQVEHYNEITERIYEDAINESYNVMLSDVNEDNEFELYVTINQSEDYDIIEHILKGNNDNCVRGTNHWNYMLITGVDMAEYEESVKLLEEWQENFYNVVKIEEDKEKSSFSVLIETSTYCVLEGDTLSEIAHRKMTTVNELMRLNPHIEDPDLIYIHDFIRIR